MNPSEKNRLRILSLEDSDLDAELIFQEIKHGGIEFDWHRVQTRTDYEREIDAFQPDLILADYRLPGFNGAQALAIAKIRCPDIPLIIISGAVGEETAVELLKDGATDFVLKDRLTRLVPAVHRALREVAEVKARKQAEKDLRALNEELEQRVTDRTRELSEKNAVMEEDLGMARELQMAFLPRRFPTIPAGTVQANSAVKFYSIYRPTNEMSGDFFNVVRVSETAIGVLICDVMGHGVRAALVAAMMRAIEGQLGDSAGDPGELLTHLNHSLQGILHQAGTTLFVTAFYLIVDTATSHISFANAGHPSPLLVRSTPREVQPLGAKNASGPALGLFEDVKYTTQTRPVVKDDYVLFFTDGLFEVENTNDESFGERRLRETVHQLAGVPPQQLLQDLFDKIELFAKGRDFSDDVCLVGMEIVHLDGCAK